MTGAILAGGKATRMGRDKAQVEFRNTPMLSHVAGALAAAGLDVLVVGRRDNTHVWINDMAGLGGGPAVGLISALRHTQDDVLLVAVDQPLLRVETVRGLLATPGDAVVPVADGHPQVTCALYRRTCLQPFAEAIAGGERKLRRLLALVTTRFVSDWHRWGEDGRSWLSLDTPEAVRDAEALR